MNVFKQELKIQRKSFFFWCLGLFLLIFAGITKYKGIASTQGVDMNEILGKFPPVVLAILGANGIDTNTLSGYYAMMAFYAILCACIYAVFLGSQTVLRELWDKTHDFLFTKPFSRSYILTSKILANVLLLTLFSIVNYISSLLALYSLNLKDNIHTTIVYFCLTIYLISLVFYFCATFLSCVIKNIQNGTSYSVYIFLFTFLLGILSQMTEQTQFLRIFSPIRYFLPNDLIKHNIDMPYLFLSIILILFFGLGTYLFFQKKDLFAS